MKSISHRIFGGERLTVRQRVFAPGVDLSGCTWSAEVRNQPRGPLLATPGISATFPRLGVADVALTIPGSTTINLPGWVVIDVACENVEEDYGPVFPFRVYLDVLPAYKSPADATYRFSRVEIAQDGGGDRALLATEGGGWTLGVATGDGAYGSIDLRLPDLTYVGLRIDADGGLYLGEPSGTNQWPHVELTIEGGGFIRLWAADGSQLKVTHFEA